MKKAFLLGTIVCALGMMTASCSKEDEKLSEHEFSEYQQKVLELFHGTWQLGNDDIYFDFKEQFDTNVVVYKDDYVHGPYEQYQYQGVLQHIILSTNGDTSFCTTYNYFVSYAAVSLKLYDPNTGREEYDDLLEVIDQTHFRIMRSGYWWNFHKL